MKKVVGCGSFKEVDWWFKTPILTIHHFLHKNKNNFFVTPIELMSSAF